MLRTNLQLVLGNDKSRTDLTVYKTENGEFLHVYLGVALLEVVPNDKNDFFFRFLTARLYCLGISCQHMARQLNISEKTIRKLATALRSGDPTVIHRVFAGHSSKEKVCDEIKRYIEEKYWELKGFCRNFAKQIIAKVKKYWNITLSEEYLRKLFREADRKVQAQKEAAALIGTECNANSMACVRSSPLLDTANNVPDHNQTVSANSSIEKKHHEEPSRELGWETCRSQRMLLPGHFVESEFGQPRDVNNERVLPIVWSREDSCATDSLPTRSTANPRPIPKSEFINSTTQIPISVQYNQPVDRVAEFPYSGSRVPEQKRFCHHLGLVLFTPWLERFSQKLEPYFPNDRSNDSLDLIRQFQAQVLLGALNHEQSLELSFSSLEFLVGPCYSSVDYQRIQLNRLLTQDCFKGIWRANAKILGGFDKRIFYYDPHAKKYTGILQILKGWCGSAGKITDVMNLDFFHDQHGNPWFAEHFDGYYDQRERLFLCLHNFFEVFPELKNKEVLLIFDRGLYSLQLMQDLRKKNCHFITWDKDFDEKDFKPFHHRKKEFHHSFLRNHSDDFIFTHFTYYEEKWNRQPQFRQIVVHAVRDKGQSIKMAILCSDPTLDAQQIVVYIIRRWLQENDFGYMIRHSGINELTARKSQKYSADTPVVDRMVLSKEYKKLQNKKKKFETRLKNLTFQHRCLERKQRNLNVHGPGFEERKVKLLRLAEEINGHYEIYDEICKKLKTTPKKQWRKKELQDQGAKYFVTHKKAIMDSIRVSTRNIFYSAMALFRPLFNNYRSDHKIIRNLLKTPGLVYKKENRILIQLFLRYHLEKKEKEKLDQFIILMNQKINTEYNGKYMPISIQLSDDKSGPIFL